jgi:hypothetical protein
MDKFAEPLQPGSRNEDIQRLQTGAFQGRSGKVATQLNRDFPCAAVFADTLFWIAVTRQAFRFGARSPVRTHTESLNRAHGQRLRKRALYRIRGEITKIWSSR